MLDTKTNSRNCACRMTSSGGLEWLLMCRGQLAAVSDASNMKAFIPKPQCDWSLLPHLWSNITRHSKNNKILARMWSSKFFTILDFRSGYDNIQLSLEKRHKSAYTTTVGKHEIPRMPFRLAQGPAYLTALMQKLIDTLNDFCFFHMDDMLAHDWNEDNHLQHLKIIFMNIKEAMLKLKLPKCAFFKRHLQYLGHLFSGERIYPLRAKSLHL